MRAEEPADAIESAKAQHYALRRGVQSVDYQPSLEQGPVPPSARLCYGRLRCDHPAGPLRGAIDPWLGNRPHRARLQRRQRQPQQPPAASLAEQPQQGVQFGHLGSLRRDWLGSRSPMRFRERQAPTLELHMFSIRGRVCLPTVATPEHADGVRHRPCCPMLSSVCAADRTRRSSVVSDLSALEGGFTRAKV